MEKEFWEGLYQSGETRFDLQGPTIPLVDFLDGVSLKASRALVPGCGRGWDATGVDFAPSAIRDGRAAAKKSGLESRAHFEQADLFALALEPVELWWENTCYCAIEPSRRDEYAQVAARMIAPGGLLVFLVFPTDGRAGGPPFAIDPKELGSRFGGAFTIESQSAPPRASTAARAGKELLAVLRRKS